LKIGPHLPKLSNVKALTYFRQLTHVQYCDGMAVLNKMMMVLVMVEAMMMTMT